jgi:predicted nucleic acid-binding protein
VIVLDTNVISELARLAPDPGVLSWLDSLDVSGVATTAITAAELRYGIATMPDGQRKRELSEVISGILTEDFHGRVLPFDERASVRYAEIVTSRERAGRPVRHPRRSDRCHRPRPERRAGHQEHRRLRGDCIQLINPWQL